MVFAHGDFDFHTAVGIIAQYFNDFSYGRAVLLVFGTDRVKKPRTGKAASTCFFISSKETEAFCVATSRALVARILFRISVITDFLHGKAVILTQEVV